jgi:hypothetical protein
LLQLACSCFSVSFPIAASLSCSWRCHCTGQKATLPSLLVVVVVAEVGTEGRRNRGERGGGRACNSRYPVKT